MGRSGGLLFRSHSVINCHVARVHTQVFAMGYQQPGDQLKGNATMFQITNQKGNGLDKLENLCLDKTNRLQWDLNQRPLDQCAGALLTEL